VATVRQTITLAGYYFQDTSTAENMKAYVENPFGAEECPGDESKLCSKARITSCCAGVTVSTITTSCSLYSLYSDVPVRTITFEVPEGTGTGNMVNVVSAGQTNFANNCTVVKLDYSAPMVTGISSSTVPTTGGTVTLTGYNFGPQWNYDSSDWAVKLRGTALTVTDYNHTKMTLTVPAGEGTGGVFSLTVDGQTDTESNFLGYSAPTITSTSISSSGMPTRGQVVTITGTNFGTYGMARTRLSPVDYECSYKSDGSGCLAYPAAATYDATHTTLYVTMPKGQGSNTLTLNVSGQAVSTSIEYATPTLEKLTPSEASTAGGTVLNLTGSHFGIGYKYVLSLGTDSDGNSYCTSGGNCDVTLRILNYTESWMTFLSPEGQSNGGFSLSLMVCANANDVATGGSSCKMSSSSRRKLASTNVVFTFKPPRINYLAAVYEPSPSVTTYLKPNNASTNGKYIGSAFTTYDFYDSKTNVGCMRNSEDGCFTLMDSDRDSTSGGYTVVLKGSNFGTYGRVIYWGGVDVTTLSDAGGGSCNVCLLADGVTDPQCDHETIKFTVPKGVGENIPVYVVRGSTQSTTAMYFSYDPPYVTGVSPSTPDAEGDVIYIEGQNFGPSISLAGAINVSIGGVSCGAVSGASIWQSDFKVSDLPYILCKSGRLKVGYQNVTVGIAKQEARFSEADKVLRTSCNDGYFGQEAWAPYMVNGDIAYDQSDDFDIDDADDKVQFRNPYPFYPYESCQARNQYTASFDPYSKYGGGASDAASAAEWVDSPALYGNMDLSPLECMQKGGYDRTLNTFMTEDYEMCNYYRRCLIGYYDVGRNQLMNYTVLNTANEYCVACPEGATCDDANLGAFYPVEPYADAGYWRYEFEMGSADCDHSAQRTDHPSRPYCYDVWPCQPAEACVGGNVCKKGYTGEGCNQCCDASNMDNPDCFTTGVQGWTSGGLDSTDSEETQDGTLRQYRFRRFNGECVKCPDNVAMIIALFFSVAFLGGVGGYVLNKKRVNLGIFQIGIDYFQVLAMMSAIDVEWPNKLEKIFQFLSAFKFDIGIAAPECLTTLPFDITYKMKWLSVMLFPVCVLGIFLVAHIYKVSYKYLLQHKRKSRDLNSHAHRLMAFYLYLFYFIYLYTVQTALDIFNCGRIESENGEVTVDNGNTYMLSYPEYVCYSTCDANADFCQNDMWPWAALCFAVYGLGYPAFIAWVLLPAKNQYLSFQDQLLKADGQGHSKKSSYDTIWHWHVRYSRLYYLFKPQYTYWMLFILLRKLLLACIEILFRANVTFQLAAVLLNFFWAYVIHTRNHPYMSTFEYARQVSQFKNELEQLKATGKKARIVGERDTIKMQRGHKGRLSEVVSAGVRKVLEGRDITGQYLWNWNSVEAVLLMCCVLVATCGIMFSSEYVEPGDESYQALGAFTLTIVIGSLVYFFLVVWSEVVVKVSPKTLNKCQCKRCMETKKEPNRDSERDSQRDSRQSASVNMDYQTPTGKRHVMRQTVMQAMNPLMKVDAAGEVKDDGTASPTHDDVIGSLRDQVELEDTLKKLMEENAMLKKKNAAAQAGGRAAFAAGAKKTKKRVGKMQLNLEMTTMSKMKRPGSAGVKGPITFISPNDPESEEEDAI
jgi:hypothetical protein